jgi:hypothetical protein
MLDIYNKLYDFVKEENKQFILAVDEALIKMGYESGQIQPYVFWGKYVIAYKKANSKTNNYVSKFYLRDENILFRLYLKKVETHEKYIENAPDFIKQSFIDSRGRCQHCKTKCNATGNCFHRKTYTIDNEHIEKCDGMVFLFRNLSLSAIPDYINLINEFYPPKKVKT